MLKYFLRDINYLIRNILLDVMIYSWMLLYIRYCLEIKKIS